MAPSDKTYSKGASGGPVRHEVGAPATVPADARCPVEITIAPLSGKWKTVILWHLSGPAPTVRFTDLQRMIPGITPRMLARQLRELERDGMIFREVWPLVPPRVDYGLTDRGRSLRPVLDAMCAWGKANGWAGPGFG